ncbi:proteasome-type protease [Pseudaeromonas paramecii]|uniref:Proteasome-type protease n=1 Tax=Pseudaeromonas paramecii TaxID=2138166 RepID=A0ABP8Q1G2_9GAMM
MTYCVALRLAEGLVFASDSRTNAGVDHIATFKKLHTFEVPGERLLVLQSAGNLATTQSVVSLLRQRCTQPELSLLHAGSLYQAAEIIGATVREVIARDGGQQQTGVNYGCNLLLGGQIQGEVPRLFHLYPEGNFIEASEDTPYFQIGESKYGKPILDRVLTYHSPLDLALQCALISLDSTLRSNLSVGLPLDVLCYRKDSLHGQPCRIGEQDPAFAQLRQTWSEGLARLIGQLPPPPASWLGPSQL